MYGFNLILLPVNLAGVYKSLQQAASRPRFRSPAPRRSTTAQPRRPRTSLRPYAIAAFSFYTFSRQVGPRNTTNAVFAFFNAVLTTYAIVAYIGIRNSVADVVLGRCSGCRCPPARRRPRRQRADGQDVDWEAVLYFGPGTSGAVTPLPSGTAPRRGSKATSGAPGSWSSSRSARAVDTGSERSQERCEATRMSAARVKQTRVSLVRVGYSWSPSW